MAKLLVIDDDLTMGPLIRAALKTFDVKCETSGANAIAVANEAKPDVILLDLHMPNVDGFEVLRKLKNHPTFSSTPVFCLSGAIDQESRNRAIGLGAAGYFQKPINIKSFENDLTATLKSMNSILSSENQKRQFTIAFNESEKYRLMKEELHSALIKGQSPIVLSLVNGEDFADFSLESGLISGKWHYLQITSSTLAKLPYLQDLSPLLRDIQTLTHANTENVHLIVDDPHSLLGGDLNTAASRFHPLKQFFAQNFASTSIYADLEGNLSRSSALKDIAQFFCSGGSSIRAAG